ncbi:hypothetical protein B1H38_07815 [Leptospira borgpetersenii serovar Ballum]|nr:hypothetical protein B9T54_15315 [Leptospira borgpetersenii serovar Hardjo-bovis]OOV44972.1 hypothetical protein B1H38_07815 [Leptospira borgpetersenii serovar Ballum]
MCLSFDFVERIGFTIKFDPKLGITIRTHEKNIVASLFQKLECSILFKKTDNSGFRFVLGCKIRRTLGS